MAQSSLLITTSSATIATAPSDLRADESYVVRVINRGGGTVTLTTPSGTDTIADSIDDREAVAFLSASQTMTAVASALTSVEIWTRRVSAPAGGFGSAGGGIDQTARNNAAIAQAAGVDAFAQTVRAHSGLAGGRALVADQLGFQSNMSSVPSTEMIRKKHTIMPDCAGIRFGYGAGSTTIEQTWVAQQNGFYVAATLETSDGALWDMTFNGQKRAYIEPWGFVMSDAVPIDFLSGDTIWSKTFAVTPFGNAKTTLEAHSIGDTSFTTTAAPNLDFYARLSTIGPQYVQIGTEWVLVSQVTGTGPYTYTCAAMTATHASGSTVNQLLLSNASVRREVTGEGYASTDLRANTGATGLTTPSADTTTLVTAVAIGDTFIEVAASKLGATCIIDSETLTIDSQHAASPIRFYLTTPATAVHSSGATVTMSDGIRNGVGPSFIVADHVSKTRKRTVSIVGTSIPNGGGYGMKPTPWSWVNHAFPDRAHVNASKAGDVLSLFVLAANNRQRNHAIGLCDIALDEYGTNDLFGGGNSFAVLSANYVIKWRRDRVRQRFPAQCTITPKTTSSTDRWATVAGQTAAGVSDPLVPVGNYLTKYQINQWLRDGAPLNAADLTVPSAASMFSGANSLTYTPPTGTGYIRARMVLVGTTLARDAADQGHPLTLVADDASVFEVSQVDVRWIANPAGGCPLTYDGLHPTTVGHRMRGAYWVNTVLPIIDADYADHHLTAAAAA